MQQIITCNHCNAQNTIPQDATSANCAYCNSPLIIPTPIQNNKQEDPKTISSPQNTPTLSNINHTNPKPKLNAFFLTIGLICGIIPGIIYLVVKNKEKKEWENTHKIYENSFKNQ